MNIRGYDDLMKHQQCDLEVARYGPLKRPVNVALECLTHDLVLLDFDRDEVVLTYLKGYKEKDQ